MGRRTLTAIMMCAVMVLVAAAPLALADIHNVIKGEKGPNNSAVTWEYSPTEYGLWTGHIVNNGLRWMVVDVYDDTNGMSVQISHQRIRFAAYNAFPTGEVDTNSVIMAGGRLYSITVTPNGPRGSTATVEDMFVPAKPPVAVMSVTINGMTVSVDGSASYDPDGTVVSYAWSFGDGATASGATATHTYLAGGLYTITLTVTDNDGLTGSASEQVNIEQPLQAPIASFTALMDHMLVSVDASASYDPDGTIVSYAWDFGDGGTATGVTATHTYALEGVYTITLTVTDNDGLTGTATRSVTALLPVAPVASFTYSVNSLTVSVDGSGSSDIDGTIIAYAWDFGDGGLATGVTATHTYAADGTYPVTLTVVDNDGMSGSVSQMVTVKKALSAPTASFTASTNFLQVSVDGSGSSDIDGTIVSYAWNFGDGGTATGVTATHTYAAGGTYTITLTVTDNDGLTGSASKSVTVRPAIPPIASISVTTNFLQISVSGAGSTDSDGTIVSYAWTFGDGGTATGVTATHTYAAGGTYTVTLTVTDNDGLTGTASTSVSVRPAIPPIASISATTNFLDISVSGAGSTDADGTIVSYAWTFGDGGTATGVTATHTYAAGGTYTVTLTVTDNDGLTGTASTSVSVRPAIPPIASISASTNFLDVSVSGAGSTDADGTIVSYAWTFGDGGTATGVTATHTYAAGGTYTITLTVTDNDGLTGSASTSVTVRPAIPPIASISVSTNFLDVSVSGAGSTDADGTIVSYAWDFGDGGTATGVTATHTYAAGGTYTITLTVTDNDGLTGSASTSVTVRPPNPPVASFTGIVTGAVLDVDASGSSAEAGIASYTWNWGDGSAPQTTTSPTASHTYSGAAAPIVKLGSTPSKASSIVNAAPPPPPYSCFGYVTDSVGNPVFGANVLITDVTTGTTWTTTTDLDYGFYMVDLNMYFPNPVGWAAGDTIQVTATLGALTGSNSGIAMGVGNEAYLQLDIVVQSSGPAPHDVTVTLTVTDLLGRTASMSQVFTVYY